MSEGQELFDEVQRRRGVMADGMVLDLQFARRPGSHGVPIEDFRPDKHAPSEISGRDYEGKPEVCRSFDLRPDTQTTKIIEELSHTSVDGLVKNFEIRLKTKCSIRCGSRCKCYIRRLMVSNRVPRQDAVGSLTFTQLADHVGPEYEKFVEYLGRVVDEASLAGGTHPSRYLRFSRLYMLRARGVGDRQLLAFGDAASYAIIGATVCYESPEA